MTNSRPSRPRPSKPSYGSSTPSSNDADKRMGEPMIKRIYGFSTAQEVREHAHKNRLNDGDYSVGFNERTGFYYEYKKQPTSDFKSLSKIVERKGSRKETLHLLKNIPKRTDYKYYNYYVTNKGDYVIYSRKGKGYFIDSVTNSKLHQIPNTPFRNPTEAKRYLNRRINMESNYDVAESSKDWGTGR